ncbi:hypothetical protein ST47_g7279 [Ascochyta rabiei]|uniref:Uncharacterized protein n=1 Tax=Didymella rabiei TaxID=5454 RepID=A0A163B564_DIDRA|nr:hypothetical protein ST47_g7279 [Ascochyta rabiei]
MSSDSAPRMVRVLAPRMSPIVTDGTVSIVLTDDYRLSPYMRDGDPDTNMPRTIIPEKLTTRSASVPLQYALGINLDAAKIWLEESLPDGFRAMDPNWVLFFDCNPDLMLARSFFPLHHTWHGFMERLLGANYDSALIARLIKNHTNKGRDYKPSSSFGTDSWEVKIGNRKTDDCAHHDWNLVSLAKGVVQLPTGTDRRHRRMAVEHAKAEGNTELMLSKLPAYSISVTQMAKNPPNKFPAAIIALKRVVLKDTNSNVSCAAMESTPTATEGEIVDRGYLYGIARIIRVEKQCQYSNDKIN